MDVEFKLIGDLTMRQFFYLMIFSGIAYAAWTFNVPPVLKWPIVIISVLLGIGFAFVPIEDRGLDEWIVNFFSAVYSENQLIWKKKPTPPSAFLQANISIVQQELITLAPTTSRRKLEQYLTHEQKDEKLDALDLREQEFIEKVRAAYMTEPAKTAVAVETPSVEIAEAYPMQPPSGEPEKEGLEPSTEGPEKKQKPATKAKLEIKKAAPRAKKVTFNIPTNAVSAHLNPVTPNRHTGRKFTNLLASEGSLVLPIRGEKTLLPFEQTPEPVNTQEKADNLKMYLQQLEQTEGISIEKNKKEKAEVSQEATEVMKKIQEENEKLMTEIEKLKQKSPEEKKDSIKQLVQKQKHKEETIKNLASRVKELGPQELGVPADESSSKELEAPTAPNVVTGIVKNFQGRGISGVLLIIKNAHNDPVRAIKTNALGQFTISNPLANGKYKINIDVNNETGFSFDIIDVEATGGIIPPLEFIGK
jgi:hypothetical protein